MSGQHDDLAAIVGEEFRGARRFPVAIVVDDDDLAGKLHLARQNLIAGHHEILIETLDAGQHLASERARHHDIGTGTPRQIGLGTRRHDDNVGAKFVDAVGRSGLTPPDVDAAFVRDDFEIAGDFADIGMLGLPFGIADLAAQSPLALEKRYLVAAPDRGFGKFESGRAAPHDDDGFG